MSTITKTEIISICGIDGTGKTTILNYLRARGFTTLRVPQVHESGDFEVSNISQKLELLSQKADQEKNLVEKSCLLFLAMSLVHQAEKELLKNSYQYLFCERNTVIDFLVYSPIYLQILKRNDTFVGLKDNPEIENFFLSLNLLFTNYNLRELPQLLLNFFSLPKEIWINKLIANWKLEIPKHIVLLKVNEDLLTKRLQLKEKVQAREFHEQVPLLLKLQAGYEQALQSLSRNFGFNPHILEISEQERVDDIAFKILKSCHVSMP